jgi:hypothetical protein
MTPEDEARLSQRVREIFNATGGGDSVVMAASLLLLGDRLVGALDSVRSALMMLEDRLGDLVDTGPSS